MSQVTVKSTGKKRYRTWICTLNNPADYYPEITYEDYLRKWHTEHGARYVTGQLEAGEEETPHIQFYLNFDTAKRLKALKKLCPHAHFTRVKKDNNAAGYCNKE